MRQYAVEVLSKYSHGRYGKTKFCVWCLSEKSKQKACYFGYEVLAGMTWSEVFSEKYPDTSAQALLVPHPNNLNDLIGYDNALKYFSCRAFLLEGY